MDSQLILQKQLEKAKQENETLLRLVGKVCSIIVSQGGEIVVENDLIDRGNEMAWRVENDGHRHTFKAWIRDDLDG